MCETCCYLLFQRSSCGKRPWDLPAHVEAHNNHRAAFKEAAMIFSGIVLDIRELPREKGDLFDELLIRFDVERAYKGVHENHGEIATIAGTDYACPKQR